MNQLIMKFLILFFTILATIVPNTSFSQNNNRISIQTGLFHTFFDKSPILNTHYLHKELNGFNGLLYNSISIQYQRKINLKSSVSIEFTNYDEDYWNIPPNMLKNKVLSRQYSTFNTTYSRNVSLTFKFSFTYGAGLNFRSGLEYTIVDYKYYDYQNLYLPIEVARTVRDVGINIRTGIEYSPLKWLTLYTKFNFIGFVYMNDRAQIERIRKFYNYPKYPANFDLSWRFGIGFNFGK